MVCTALLMTAATARTIPQATATATSTTAISPWNTLLDLLLGPDKTTLTILSLFGFVRYLPRRLRTDALTG
jgi:hypothetical protein